MSKAMKISIVVAVAENRAIGLNNGLPWRLSSDLKYFKKTTLNHPIVMGRKTFESIGRPLPGRDTIVVTKQKNWSSDNVKVASSLEDALRLGEESASSRGVDEIMVIGGADLYGQVLPACSRLYLTEVHSVVQGDAFFPEWNSQEWVEVSRTRYEADNDNTHPYSFVILNRIS